MVGGSGGGNQNKSTLFFGLPKILSTYFPLPTPLLLQRSRKVEVEECASISTSFHLRGYPPSGLGPPPPPASPAPAPPPPPPPRTRGVSPASRVCTCSRSLAADVTASLVCGGAYSSGRPASRLLGANTRCVRSEDGRSLGTARRLRRRRRGAVLWLQLGPVLRRYCVPHHCERPQLSLARAAHARGARTQSVTSLRRSSSFAAADRRRR